LIICFFDFHDAREFLMHSGRIERRRLFLSISLFALAATAYGHPGHEVLPVSPSSMAHFALEPLHALPALGAGLMFVFAVRLLVRIGRRKRFER
jgi:hypothetical protein